MVDLPDVHYGEIRPELGWKKAYDPKQDLDPDDEELDRTPQHVIDMLGFDPAKEDFEK